MNDIITTIQGLKGLVSLQGVSETEIASVEKKLGLRFAADYAAYLGKFGLISARHIEITGLTESSRLNVADVTLAERQKNQLPPETYVIQDTGIEGILILQNSKGEVFEFQNGTAKKIFVNLAEFLLSL